MALVVAVWNHIQSEPTSTSVTTRDEQSQSEFETLPVSSEGAASADRPVYRYSVVPGGTFTGDELIAAIEKDAVVAAHYKTLDQTRLRNEVVSRDRYVHVSYRKGNEVLWTKKKVLLRKGETILTDGKSQVRTRCGNCISDAPLGPTAEDEPDVVEFDRLVADTPSGTSPDVAAANPATSTPGGLAGGSLPPAARGFGGSASGAPLSAGSTGSGGASDPLARATPSGVREPGVFPSNDSELPEEYLPLPGEDSTPWADIDPFPSGPFGPGGPGGPGGPSGPTVGDYPELPGGPGPINPTPVPEPGTLLLVGGGVAALIRKYRSRSR